MVWKPTSDIYHIEDKNPVSALYDEKIKVMPFVDAREDKKEIGRNIERPESIRLVTTHDNIADWLTDRFKYGLSLFGLTPVNTSETLILRGEVIRFNVIEDSRYKANTGLKFKLERPDGKVVWQGMITGSASRFGRSYKDENYYEVLSDSFIGVLHSFMTSVKLAP
jgi:hypothetical protein